VTAGVLAQTVDVGSMARYLRRSVRHFLVDQARKMPVSAVRRKVEELVATAPEFVRVPEGAAGAGRWQLASDRGRPTAASRGLWWPQRSAFADSCGTRAPTPNVVSTAWPSVAGSRAGVALHRQLVPSDLLFRWGVPHHQKHSHDSRRVPLPQDQRARSA
jgi:hypothetical protein